MHIVSVGLCFCRCCFFFFYFSSNSIFFSFARLLSLILFLVFLLLHFTHSLYSTYSSFLFFLLYIIHPTVEVDAYRLSLSVGNASHFKIRTHMLCVNVLLLRGFTIQLNIQNQFFAAVVVVGSVILFALLLLLFCIEIYIRFP